MTNIGNMYGPSFTFLDLIFILFSFNFSTTHKKMMCGFEVVRF